MNQINPLSLKVLLLGNFTLSTGKEVKTRCNYCHEISGRNKNKHAMKQTFDSVSFDGRQRPTVGEAVVTLHYLVGSLQVSE